MGEETPGFTLGTGSLTGCLPNRFKGSSYPDPILSVGQAYTFLPLDYDSSEHDRAHLHYKLIGFLGELCRGRAPFHILSMARNASCSDLNSGS